jgi:hypothetical protein
MANSELKEDIMKNPIFSMIACLFPALVLLTGCAGVPVRSLDPNPFEEEVSALISRALSAQAHTPHELGPAAVMPGALKSGKRFSRLEELVMERLIFQLRRQNDLYSLSRQNWFEFREGRPLSFMSEPLDRQRLLQNLIVYEVAVSQDRALNHITIRLSAADAQGRTVPGVTAEVVFDASPQGVAARLYDERPAASPFPEGLEERPYESLDRLAFSLASELADAYRNGMWAGQEPAAHEEVRVVLCPSRPSGAVAQGLTEAVQNALQQSIVATRGFTCALSRTDFGPVLQQIDFYRRNASVFMMEASPFTTGTVLLMADISPSRHNHAVGVALRAVWRTGPLESAAGNLIPTDMAGTYLSGFTAQAYLSRNFANQDRAGTGHIDRPGQDSISLDHHAAPLTRTVPPGHLGLCFYEFTEVFEKRIYSVLAGAPGVTQIRRADDLCDSGQRCLCYELQHEGTEAEISAWLHAHLRTSEVLAFRLAPKGGGRLNVYFDGGFR